MKTGRADSWQCDARGSDDFVDVEFDCPECGCFGGVNCYVADDLMDLIRLENFDLTVTCPSCGEDVIILCDDENRVP